jgi:hypothetical protein
MFAVFLSAVLTGGMLMFFVDGSSAAAPSFSQPTYMAVGGGHLWVASASSTVTELNENSGALVSAINSLPSYTVQGVSNAGIVLSGANVWVANSAVDAVSELDASNGLVIRTVSGTTGGVYKGSPKAVGPSGPHISDIASSGDRLWIAIRTAAGGWVTEINAQSGSLIRLIRSPTDDFDGVSAIAVSGAHVWVANYGAGVTELNANNGSLVRVVNRHSDGFAGSNAIAVVGNEVLVSNHLGNSVTELSASTGSLVRIIKEQSDGLDEPTALAVRGSDVWVTNENDANLDGRGSVVELNVSNGSLIRRIDARADKFSSPAEIAISGAHLWITNQTGNTVTEINTSNGALVRTIN